MKQLLERWSKLEPHLCRYDKIMNSFAITFDGKWWGLITEDSLMQIQWAIQQTVIEKGWYVDLLLFSDKAGLSIKVGRSGEYNQAIRYPHTNIAEALLDSYLKVLDVNP